MSRPALLTALLLIAAPAMAQDRPPIMPTRDVSVTYRMLGGQGPQAQQPFVISWNTQLGAMRSDMPGGMGWMVAEPRQGRAFMVMEQQRMVMDLPVGQVMQQHMNSPTATFRREGNATVAGLPCTIWIVEDRGNTGRACVTADGVSLRVEGTAAGGQTGGMEATAVSFGPQDPARFQRPQGYQSMQMPGGPPPGARGGAATTPR